LLFAQFHLTTDGRERAKEGKGEKAKCGAVKYLESLMAGGR